MTMTVAVLSSTIAMSHLPNPTRVATQYLTGGLFEGPPAIEIAILHWMQSVYASHVLYQTEQTAASARDYSAPYKTAISQLELALAQTAKIPSMKPGEQLRLVTPEVSNRGIIKPMVMGIKNTDYVSGSVSSRSDKPFVIGFGTKNVSYDNLPRAHSDKTAVINARFVIEDSIENANWMLEQITTNPRVQAKLPAVNVPALVELELLRKECLKHTARAKNYSSLAKTTVPVDITGWRYADKSGPMIAEINKHRQTDNLKLTNLIEAAKEDLAYAQSLYDRAQKKGEISITQDELVAMDVAGNYWNSRALDIALRVKKRPSAVWVKLNSWSGGISVTDAETLKKPLLGPSDVQQALDIHHWKEITVILNFMGHETRAGQWSKSRRELQVDIASYKEAKSVQQFKAGLDWIAECVRHETQHLGQDLLQTLAQLKENAGLPSPSIRQDPATRQKGQRGNDTGTGLGSHALLDFEYTTDLADAIDIFIRASRKIPLDERANAVRSYVGLSTLGRDTPMELRVKPSWAFAAWKKQAPKKWRAAVSEFVKQIQAAGVKLSGNQPVSPVRVAVRYDGTGIQGAAD